MSVVTNPISNIPVNNRSHVFGWAELWAEQTNSSINHKCTPAILNADKVYIDHGVNFGGTMNLFGGVTKEIYDKINLVASHDNIVSLDHDMPDWGAMFKKRIGSKSTYEGITEKWCDMLSARLKNVPSLKQEDLEYDSISVGDSHTLAFSGPNHRVFRNDGKTLHGSLKNGLVNLLRGVEPTGSVFISLGSIDIRHHLLRHDNRDLKAMIQEYVKQGTEIEYKYEGVQVYYCYPVPVEYEERRLPKTGYYKGTPFFGTQQERAALTKEFIDILEDESGGMTIDPPSHWYTMDPQKYAETIMENNSSVHISPPYYYRKDWGESPLGA